jgi:uncharacterized membrane-anchored protein YhcB (DUF1043 family)/protein required for attachment to host cells
VESTPAPEPSWQQLALQELQQQRQSLEGEIKELEQRRDQLQAEISSHFTGQADGLSRRVKGFQDYLQGALVDLARSVEQLELVPETLAVQPSPLDQQQQQEAAKASEEEPAPAPVSASGLFAGETTLITERLAAFRDNPDFHADAWQLRRSLDQSGHDLLSDWFLSQGGRGAQPSGGSRSRNVLVTAAAVSLLGDLYGDRFQTLVLAGAPERLGDWRRGLQDGLGLSREDFGPNSGVVLFERPDALIERADRLEEQGELPFIVVDAAERAVETAILQFPLWLVFAADPQELAYEEELL